MRISINRRFVALDLAATRQDFYWDGFGVALHVEYAGEPRCRGCWARVEGRGLYVGLFGMTLVGSLKAPGRQRRVWA